MMYLEEFRQAATARFEAQFIPLYPSTPIQWLNVDFDQPDNQIYVTFKVIEAGGGEAEIGKGTKTERYIGIVRMVTHEPEGKGSRNGNLIRADMSRIFFRQSLVGADWTAKFTRRIREGSPVHVKDWVVTTIDVNYERDERNSD